MNINYKIPLKVLYNTRYPGNNKFNIFLSSFIFKVEKELNKNSLIFYYTGLFYNCKIIKDISIKLYLSCSSYPNKFKNKLYYKNKSYCIICSSNNNKRSSSDIIIELPKTNCKNIILLNYFLKKRLFEFNEKSTNKKPLLKTKHVKNKNVLFVVKQSIVCSNLIKTYKKCVSTLIYNTNKSNYNDLHLSINSLNLIFSLKLSSFASNIELLYYEHICLLFKFLKDKVLIKEDTKVLLNLYDVVEKYIISKIINYINDSNITINIKKLTLYSIKNSFNLFNKLNYNNPSNNQIEIFIENISKYAKLGNNFINKLDTNSKIKEKLLKYFNKNIKLKNNNEKFSDIKNSEYFDNYIMYYTICNTKLITNYNVAISFLQLFYILEYLTTYKKDFTKEYLNNRRAIRLEFKNCLFFNRIFKKHNIVHNNNNNNVYTSNEYPINCFIDSIIYLHNNLEELIFHIEEIIKFIIFKVNEKD